MMIRLTWTMEMRLIRQIDEYDYDETENIILAYISCIITFEIEQFECISYKYILICFI